MNNESNNHDANNGKSNSNKSIFTHDLIVDCRKRAHAFIVRSESADEVTLPGWIARKISAYIIHLEKD